MTKYLTDCLIYHKDKNPTRKAIIYKDIEITFERLYQLSVNMAANLKKMKLNHDRICILTPTIPELPISYFASFLSGAIIVPINYSYKSEEITKVLENCKPRGIIVDNSLLPELQKIDQELLKEIEFKYLIVENASDFKNESFRPFQELIKLADSDNNSNFEHDKTNPTQPSIIFHTSGTTRKPKGVIHTHRSISYFAYCYSILSKGDSRPVTIVSRNCYHSGGFFHLMGALSNGVSCVLADDGASFDSEKYLNNLIKYKATQIFLNVSLLNSILSSKNISAKHFSNIHFISVGADVVKPFHHQKVREFTNRPLIVRYSSTEATCVTINVAKDIKIRENTIGKPFSYFQYRIDQQDGSEAGELLLKGESLFLGYDNNETANCLSFTRDGWYKTGDLVKLDTLGNLVFCGRKGHTIKVSGKIIYPIEIEYLANSCHWVEQSVAVPIDDPIHVQRPFLFLKLSFPYQQLYINNLWNVLKEQIAEYKVPVGLAVVSSFPVTRGAKVDRKRLTEYANWLTSFKYLDQQFIQSFCLKDSLSETTNHFINQLYIGK